MGRVIVGMTISVDGFVQDASGSAERLYPDLAALRGTPFMDGLIDQTGAVLMGRRSYDMAEDPDWYVGNYEFQCPIFVVTNHPPERLPKQDERLAFSKEGARGLEARGGRRAGVGRRPGQGVLQRTGRLQRRR
ncbi:MAG: hypothetical protein ACRD2W_10045 [Acidimicrobiales bacterium]